MESAYLNTVTLEYRLRSGPRVSMSDYTLAFVDAICRGYR